MIGWLNDINRLVSEDKREPRVTSAENTHTLLKEQFHQQPNIYSVSTPNVANVANMANVANIANALPKLIATSLARCNKSGFLSRVSSACCVESSRNAIRTRSPGNGGNHSNCQNTPTNGNHTAKWSDAGRGHRQTSSPLHTSIAVRQGVWPKAIHLNGGVA